MAATALSLVRSCELTLMTGGFQSICLLDHPATVPFPKPAKEWQLQNSLGETSPPARVAKLASVRMSIAAFTK